VSHPLDSAGRHCCQFHSWTSTWNEWCSGERSGTQRAFWMSTRPRKPGQGTKEKRGHVKIAAKHRTFL